LKADRSGGARGPYACLGGPRESARQTHYSTAVPTAILHRRIPREIGQKQGHSVVQIACATSSRKTPAPMLLVVHCRDEQR
jgi:hypothetical protein